MCKIETLLAYEALPNKRQSENPKTYWDYKHRPMSAYQTAKGLLRGIPKKVPGTGVWQQLGDVWSTCAPEEMTEDQQAPPFKGWLISGKDYESFTSTGELLRGADDIS